jgi:hypothetical protein
MATMPRHHGQTYCYPCLMAKTFPKNFRHFLNFVRQQYYLYNDTKKAPIFENSNVTLGAQVIWPKLLPKIAEQ